MASWDVAAMWWDSWMPGVREDWSVPSSCPHYMTSGPATKTSFHTWRPAGVACQVTEVHSGHELGQWVEALHSHASTHWSSPYPQWSLGNANKTKHLAKALIWLQLSWHGNLFGLLAVWSALCYNLETAVEQTVQLPLIRGIMALMSLSL